MNTTRNIRRLARRFAALIAAGVVLGSPAVASADKLLLSEITVVAVALDTQTAPKDLAAELNETALENARRAIDADNAAVLAELAANVDLAQADADES
ncbi:MAG: hypothetical protein AAGC71_01260 [Pseudomonadota bacterium]